MSTVYMNRMMMELRGQGLITSKGRRVTVHDLDRLMKFSEFNPNYVHQHGGRSERSRA